MLKIIKYYLIQGIRLLYCLIPSYLMPIITLNTMSDDWNGERYPIRALSYNVTYEKAELLLRHCSLIAHPAIVSSMQVP